eukprot:scaffold33906_cov99-Amphora_coffeaeformis.AAC.1
MAWVATHGSGLQSSSEPTGSATVDDEEGAQPYFVGENHFRGPVGLCVVIRYNKRNTFDDLLPNN